MKPEAPQWLKDRLLFQRQDRGKAYALSVVQGFLEVPDWAYYLQHADGTNLLAHPADFEKLFDAIFSAATDPAQQHRVRVVATGRAQHAVMVSGPGLAQHLEATGCSASYVWRPDDKR